MAEVILLGRGRQIEAIPRAEWETRLSQLSADPDARLRFMSKEHHLVRYFIVRELPRFGAPLAPALISQDLDLPVGRVVDILDDLERNLFFLVRNEGGDVSWAYPVTTDETPHYMAFSTGERLYGA